MTLWAVLYILTLLMGWEGEGGVPGVLGLRIGFDAKGREIYLAEQVYLEY